MQNNDNRIEMLAKLKSMLPGYRLVSEDVFLRFESDRFKLSFGYDPHDRKWNCLVSDKVSGYSFEIADYFLKVCFPLSRSVGQSNPFRYLDDIEELLKTDLQMLIKEDKEALDKLTACLKKRSEEYNKRYT